MKKILHHIKKIKQSNKWLLYPFLLLIVFFVADCGVYFDVNVPVDEPASVNAGDTMTMVLHTKYQVNGPKNDLHLVAGFLAPKGWKAAQNSTVYFTSNITTGVQSMTVVPISELPPGANGMNWETAVKSKYGYGSNVIDDLEWVIFWSTNTYSVDHPQAPLADITIKVKTGMENLQYKRGYFISESIDAFTTMSGSDFNQAFFTGCFAIANGSGELVDFCFPKIGVVDPPKAKADDIITFRYDGDLDNSELKNEQDVFLCAKAYTTNEQIIEICVQENKSKMKLWATHKWRIDLWPRKYFNLPSGQQISKIEYYFTNKSGTIKTGFANTLQPFKYVFNCN